MISTNRNLNFSGINSTPDNNNKISSIFNNKKEKKIHLILTEEKTSSTNSKIFNNDRSNPKFNGIKTVTIDFEPMKNIAISPMHRKLYESSYQQVKKLIKNFKIYFQDKNIKKVHIPESHSSYKKLDDSYKPITTPTFKKKMEFYKTTYNFLKNYH